ncbi:MAG: ATP-binding cassette domain-containing protein [Acetobacterium sp.]|uniref:methionine ABC transporter ATP-binding protein n=1 Tax=Acetobacterium sp. TaxID=1872094 RepID=UPI0032424814
MIEFKHVSVSFKQRKQFFEAVNDANFKIEKGEIFGIAGSSGAGKSTLLRTINLLQTVSSGEILVDGENVTNYRRNQLRILRRNIGMIFQHFNLARNLTVKQNIAFVLKAAGKSKSETETRVNELLELVNLSDKANSYPANLSGGEKQRVAIARALANDAKILLCDEPTSALDLETTSSILSLLKDLNKKFGITIVIITHELDVIKSICTRCAVMNKGAVVEIGNVYDIFTKPREDFTRQLLSHTNHFNLPEQIINKMQGPIVRLTFKGDNANHPILYYAANTFQIGFNILLGKIEYINDLPLGILYVQLIGEADTLKLAIEFLAANTADLEVINHGL